MRIANMVAEICKNIFSPQSAAYSTFRTFYRYMDSFTRLRKRKRLEFGINVTQHCNLNCACCSQFSPLVDEYFYPLETFKRECEHLLKLGKLKVSGINFAGGEPLLHPDLTSFFDIARSCFDAYNPDGKLIVISNGILLLRQPQSFWKTVKKIR
ncbi:MAG: radical SAM protein [Spirochaetaceae bacterium]|jgi:MoaA/NifB/PqqE/SkfB family radical SAM enzyme|nr:radical SAM protein [Spirochaetaceae bacterium]